MPSPDKPAPRSAGGHPTKERVEEIHSRLVMATLEAFARDGNDYSVDEIARLAGVSKQAIYRRWRSKTELLLYAIDDQVFGRENLGLETIPDDPVAALHAIARHYFGQSRGAGGRLSLFLRAQAENDPDLHERLWSWRSHYCASIRDHVVRIRSAAGLPIDEAEDQAELLIDMVFTGADRADRKGLSAADSERLFERLWGWYRLILLA